MTVDNEVTGAIVSGPNQVKTGLRAENVSIQFAGLKALDGVSIDIQKGEVVGLIGPNGSGKTTLLNTLTGVYRQTSGDVFIDDVKVNKKPEYKFAQLGVSRTFQNLRLFTNLTVHRNVEAGALLQGKLFGDSLSEEASRILNELELEQYAERPAGDLPYGVRRRVEIARALATKPSYLLLDEPAAGANGRESVELAAFIEQIAEKYDLGILVIEHDLRLMMRVADRIAVLTSGKKIAEGLPSEIAENPLVHEAYFGKKGVA